MFGILSLGFLLGMQHALEADHIAAVSSIAARRSDISDIVKHGLTWGLGHTLTLFIFAGAAILLGHAIPDTIARPIETAVGVMLIGLGAHVLWRLWRDRVHFHEHRHGDGTRHIHLHSHAGETITHASSAHAHVHGFRWRTLLVGLMHGMAGSAALLVLAVSQAASPATAVAYVLLFGLGSMLGMGALSAVIAVPLAVSARWLTWANRGLQGAVGVVTIAVGAMTIYAAGLGSAHAQDAAPPPPGAAVSGTPSGVVALPGKQPKRVRTLAVRGDPDPGVQHATLYDETAADPKGREYAGTVVWRIERVKDPSGPGTAIAIRAEIWIPGRKLTMTLSFRRHTDAALPASHTVDLAFNLPGDFTGGGVVNVPGILMQTADQAGGGTPLAGVVVKVTDGVFLLGLSNVEADRAKNLALMKTRPRLEIPLVYADQRRGLLALDKGEPGERVFAAAIAAWEQPSAPTTPETATPAIAGGYLVQVASQRSEAAAQAAYRALQAKFPAVLGQRSPLITRTDLGDKGVYWRVTIGPFETADAADQVCGELKMAGGQCVVRGN